MHVFGLIAQGLGESFSMFWGTLWALVLGFGLSGVVQAFVSRERMQRSLGDRRPKTLAKASLFGVISSSCSYAASALAKTLFQRGADLTASLAFMIASTNLVVELGLVLWLLMGWQFALAEFVGGAIMIALLGLIAPVAFPRRVADEARAHLEGEQKHPDAAHGHHAHDGAAHDGTAHTTHAGHDHEHMVEAAADPHVPLRRRLRSRAAWSDAAAYTISDLTMLRKELVIGFLVAGLLSALVPMAVWQSVFWTGHGFASSLENAIVGPFIAIISFVCSVGNVPLADALWHGGIGFGGVIAFVFADLITLPLLAIYRGYFGTRATWRILLAFWATMSAAGLAVEYLFVLLRVPMPHRGAGEIAMSGGFGWNHTTILNILALAAFGILYWLYRTRRANARYAKDPVCGMQVEIAHAPARRERDGETYYFCSDRCAHRFDEQSQGRHENDDRIHENDQNDQHNHHQHENGHPMQHSETGSHVDPVCGMRVDPATAAGHLEHAGVDYYFCSAGCRTAFGLNPDVFLAQQA